MIGDGVAVLLAAPVPGSISCDAPFDLPLEAFVLTGKTLSEDGLCGAIDGYSQFLTQEPADRISLDGSSFGAVRIEAEDLPDPVARRL